MTTGHTIKAFDRDLDQLRASIAEMGPLVAAAQARWVRSRAWNAC